MQNENAAATPLWELLRAVPRHERLTIDNGYVTHCIPVGRHCHDAADLLQQYESAKSEGQPVDKRDMEISWESLALNKPNDAGEKDNFRAGYKAGRRSMLFESPKREVSSQGILDNWQPIETAPKDGTRILLWDGEEWLARWQPYEGGYWDADEYISENPTHWMLLPKPPTNQIEVGSK